MAVRRNFIFPLIFSLVVILGANFLGTIAHAQIVTFSTNRQLGDTGPDIQALQHYLNTHGYVVATSGPGSVGHETTKFGSATRQALIEFQKANNLTAEGYFGPLTRSLFNGVPQSSSTTALSGSQIDAIISLLQSFGADQTTITNVRTALGGGVAIVPSTMATSSVAATSSVQGPGIIQPVAPGNGYTPGFGGGGAPPTCSISASASNISNGQNTTLTWSSSHAVSATLNGSSVGVSDSSSVSPSTDTTYTLSVKGGDGTGSCSVVIDVAPIVTSVVGTPTGSTTAIITWTTNKAASSIVNYGTSASYGSSASSATLTTAHSVTIIGLTASTVYHFQVQSTDAAGNITTGSDQTFTTLPSWVPVSGTTAPTMYADFTTEGSSNHYWYNSATYSSASTLLTAVSGPFTRSSTAYARTSSGTLTSFGSGAMRLTDLGLTIENSSTNLGFPSEFTGPSFFSSVVNASIASSSTVGPNGSTTFYATASTTAAGGARQKNLTVTNDGSTYQDSIFVASKAGGQTVRWLAGLTGGTAKQTFVDFNITTGAITGGTGVVQAVSGGWRVSVLITNNSSGNTTLYSQFYPAGGSGSGIADFGGWQLEKQSVVSSYMQTTSGTVTRAADVLTRTGGADLSAASGEVDISAHTSVGTSTQVLWQRDDGTQNNRLTIYRDSTRFIHFVVVSGGVTQSDRTTQVVNDDTDFTVAFAWSGTLASYTLNGGTPFIEAAVTLPSGLTTDRIGEDTSGNQWGGRIKTIASYPSATISPLTFYDSFNRANTTAGVISNPPVGSAYTLYGPWAGSYPLPAATNGYISNKGYVEDQNNITYMEQNLGHAVSQVGAKFSWTPSNGSTGNATLAILVYNNPGNIDSCLHIQIYRSQAIIQKRVNGAFTTLATVNYSQTLSKDGTMYDAAVTISGSTVTLTVNGVSASATDSFFSTIDGNYVIWENYMQDAIDALKVQSVSAQ